ncbi:MAG: lytic murein transglycosylase [Nocardioidaceae bacterium]
MPLALLSGAWTTSLAMTSSASAEPKPAPTLPDGSTVPTKAIEAPASVSVPGEIAPGVPSGTAGRVLAGASTSGIPAVALAAYQRAAQVIDAADPSCHLDWPLVAAIGRVESDHGRYGGNTLTSSGLSKPGIYGIPLDGSNGTAKVSDTDAGQFDNDPVYDRAVGPMQVIPTTWAGVGVDGDGDGKRNPQDINDAALATAVYLCSGKENLSTPAGQQAAVYRYNHSQSYVDLVLSIMRAYARGDYSAVPNQTYAPTTFAPFSGSALPGHATHGKKHQKAHGRHAGSSTAPGSGAKSSTGSSGSGSASSGGSTSGVPAAPSTPKSDPVKKTTDTVKKVTDGVKKATDGAPQATQPVVDTLSAGAESVSFCAGQLSSLTSNATVVNACAAKVAGMTKDQAAAAIPNTLQGVLSWLGLTGLLGGGSGSGGGLLGGN